MGTVVSQKLAKQLPKRRKYKNVLSLKVKKKRSKKIFKEKKRWNINITCYTTKIGNYSFKIKK